MTRLTSHESSYYGSPLWRSKATAEFHHVLIYPNCDELEEAKILDHFPMDALIFDIGWYDQDTALRARLADLGQVVFDVRT